MRLLAVDEDGLPVQPGSGVHRLADDAHVLPDLHRPAVDADRLVGLGGGLGALVDEPDGDSTAGQLDGCREASRAGADDEHLGLTRDGSRTCAGAAACT